MESKLMNFFFKALVALSCIFGRGLGASQDADEYLFCENDSPFIESYKTPRRTMLPSTKLSAVDLLQSEDISHGVTLDYARSCVFLTLEEIPFFCLIQSLLQSTQNLEIRNMCWCLENMGPYVQEPSWSLWGQTSSHDLRIRLIDSFRKAFLENCRMPLRELFDELNPEDKRVFVENLSYPNSVKYSQFNESTQWLSILKKHLNLKALEDLGVYTGMLFSFDRYDPRKEQATGQMKFYSQIRALNKARVSSFFKRRGFSRVGHNYQSRIWTIQR